MYATFPTRLPLEVFHDVCDVSLGAIDPRLQQRFVKQLSRRSYERLSGKVFVVAWLLTHKHNSRSLRSRTKHGLGSAFVEIAGSASLCDLSELGE
jgi:hypothetical protein